MRFLCLISIIIVAAIAAAGTYAWLGYYNVAASAPHAEFVHAALQTIRDNSIERQAEVYLGAAPPLDDPEMIRTGARHYAEEGCADCHGGPGAPQGELAEYMSPQPPDLADTATRWSNAQLYWIMENGIKMTAMPAFGATHDEDELWAMVAFVRKLTTMSPQEYERIMEEATSGGPRHAENESGHEHDEPAAEPPENEGD